MEWSKIYSRADLGEVELLHAGFVNHRYARHAHECAVIGLVESGIQSYRYRGSRYRTGPNGIFTVNPDELHTGEAGAVGGYVYRALYPSPGFLWRLLGAEGIHQLHFSDPVIYDASLADALRRAHIAVERGESLLTCEALLLDAIVGLMRRNGTTQLPAQAKTRSARFEVRHVREFIDSDPGRDMSLTSLANMVQLSPFHLAHIFSQETGTPVRVYADVARMRLAKSLLKNGVSISEVAVRLGFVDQAHFTRRFKQFLGFTPGQYQRSLTPGGAAARRGSTPRTAAL